jgi:preprotein translocase subunit YajC
MDFFISSAHAQAAGAAPQGPGLLFNVVLFGGLLLMMFLMMRSQSKRAKEHQRMVDGLQRGEEIVVSGGIAGKIEDISDNFLTVEIAPNVKIKVEKHAVTKLLPKGSLKNG